MEIKQLDSQQVWRANSNSFNGNRGTLAQESYKSYVEEVLGWEISDSKKQKILDQLYIKFSKRYLILKSLIKVIRYYKHHMIFVNGLMI